MAERNDSQEPTSQTAPAITAVEATPTDTTMPSDAALATGVPEIAAAPALVPSETPQIEIARHVGTQSESTAPEIKLPPAAQIRTPPTRSRFGRVLTNRGAKPLPNTEIKPAPVKAAPQTSRFPLLAATLALSAGVGGAAGAAVIPALVHLAFPPAPTVTAAQETAAEISAIRGLAAQLASDLGAFRNAVELNSRNATAQVGKLTERLDRAERGQADPGGKLAKISEAVDRLERRAAADHSEVTGSIAKLQPPPPQAPVEKVEAKPKPTIIDDYVVRRVFDGVALVEGRRGIIEVGPGFNLPGAGRVEEIRRQDGRWVVVTTKGLIVPAR